MDKGIDYGMGQTNIDRTNGIRYGVISIHSLHEWAHESFEADYGPPSCPKCGGDASEPDGDVDEPYERYSRGCDDYACDSCRIVFDSADAYPDEPAGGFVLDDGEYSAQLDSYNDVFLVRSPYFTRAQFCSPCAPGACHLDNPTEEGERAYCFGHDWFEDGIAPYPVYSVATGEQVNPK